MVRKRLYITFAMVLFTVVFGTTGYFIIFNGEQALLDCLYMTVVTLSTVGYGEILDISHNDTAKIFTIFLMVSGIGLLAYAFSLVTTFLIEGELSDILRKHRMEQKIAKLSNHYIICGMGDTGRCVLDEFLKLAVPIVVIENSREALQRYGKEELEKLLFIEGDSTEDDVLISAGIERAEGVMAVLPSDKDNLFITVTARQLNPNLRIVAKGVGRKTREKLLRAGATSVVCPNSIGGLRMASEMIRPNVVSFLDIMLRDSLQTIRIEEVKVKKGARLEGVSIGKSQLKEKFDILVLAIMLENKEIKYNPPSAMVIKGGMTLIVMGNHIQVKRVKKRASDSSPTRVFWKK